MNMMTPFGSPLSDRIVIVPIQNPEIQEDRIIDGINPEIREEGDNHPDCSENPEIRDDHEEPSLVSHCEHWTIHMPARYITNHVGLSNISKGEENPIMLLLRDKIDELQTELNKRDADIPDIQQALIDIETAYVNTSLAEPIDDPDACDPSTVNEAKISIYWTEWLVAMYEEGKRHLWCQTS